MDLDSAAHRHERRSIEVKRPTEVGIGGHNGTRVGLTEQVQGEFSLREEEVPVFEREQWSRAGQDPNKMLLERLDGDLSDIASVAAGRY